MSGPSHTSQHKPAEAGAQSPDQVDHDSGVSRPLAGDTRDIESGDQANFAAQIDALLASAQLEESENPIAAPSTELAPQETPANGSITELLPQEAQSHSTSQTSSAPSPSTPHQSPPASKFPQAALDDSLTDDLEALLKQVQDSVENISTEADTTPHETQLITSRDASPHSSRTELTDQEHTESDTSSGSSVNQLTSPPAQELPGTAGTIAEVAPTPAIEPLSQATTIQSTPLPSSPSPIVSSPSSSSVPAMAPSNTAAPSPHTGTIEQLDAQLARLTEELSLDAVAQAPQESSAPDAAQAAPSSPAPLIAPVSQSPPSWPSPAAIVGTNSTAGAAATPATSPSATHGPAATEKEPQKPKLKGDSETKPVLESQLLVAPRATGPTFKQRFGKLVEGLSPALLRIFAPLAAPVRGQAPIIRTAIAVFSLFTVSSAAFAWYYTLVVRPAKFAQASIPAFDLEHGELPSAPDAHDTAATKEAAGDDAHAEEKAKEEPKAKKQAPKAPTRKPDSKKEAKKPEAKKEAAGGH